MDILELQKQINTFLLTKSSNVFFEEAPDDATFPYVVWNLPYSTELEDREDFILDIDVLDKAQDTTVIDTLVGNIDGDGDKQNPTGLHRKLIYIADTLSVKAYREQRLILNDPDKRIKRRQIRYILQTYLGG